MLDCVEIPAAERTPFLNTCFDLQTAALRNRQEIPGSTTSPASSEPFIAPMAFNTGNALAETSVHLLEQDGKLVQYLGQPSETPPAWRSGGSVWKDGDWINFHLPDGEALCGRLCEKSLPSGTVVLYNSEWGYAVALAPALLEEQLRNSQARIVSEDSLFDTAAERALGQITGAATGQ